MNTSGGLKRKGENWLVELVLNVQNSIALASEKSFCVVIKYSTMHIRNEEFN